MKQAYLLLGEILRPQGIKGEVKLRHYTDDPGRFAALKTVYLKEGEDYLPRNVLKARSQQEDVYLLLEGVPDRNAAEALRGKEIWVDRAHARELAEGEAYIADLIGTSVKTTTGRELGKLTEVVSTGRVDIFVIQDAGGEWMVPALKEVLLTLEPENILLDEEKLQEVGLYENRRS